MTGATGLATGGASASVASGVVELEGKLGGIGWTKSFSSSKTGIERLNHKPKPRCRHILRIV